MKKIFYPVAFLLFIACPLLQAQGSTCNLDSTYSFTWDTLGNTWQFGSKDIHTYDANNNETIYLTETWNGTVWVNTEMTSQTFDANNNKTSYLYQTWNGTVWVNGFRFFFTYDANNNVTIDLAGAWNGTAWVNNVRTSYTYDANNNRTSYLYETWNGTVWVNNARRSYTYDANNNETSRLDETWNGTVWVNNTRSSYTYDANNNLTNWLTETWNGTVWVNNVRFTSTYDANNNYTSQLRETWSGTAWVNNTRSSHTFDANNNWTSYLIETWNGTVWENTYMRYYTYDANNKVTSQLDETWNGTVWVNTNMRYYTYDANNNRASDLHETWNGTVWVNSDSTQYYYSCASCNTSSAINASICQGQSYLFNGVNQTTGGAYLDTLVNGAGCDSIITLNLVVNQPSAFTLNNTICFGTSFPFNGQNLTTAGTYYDTLTNVAGCDSLITLNLSLNSFASSSFNQNICSGNSYSYNGQNLTQSGNYADTLLASGGCDSIVTLHLTVNNPLTGSFAEAICAGNTYLFNGQQLSQAGAYNDTLQNGNGCDSIVTLNLTLNALPQPTVTKTLDTLSTQTYVSYQWLRNGAPINGETSQKLTLTQTGNYSVVVTDANGCSDTSTVLNITSVDVKDIMETYGVKLYPNPNTGQFVIEFSDDVQRDVEITDAIGRAVLSSVKVEKQKQISLNETAAGIYFLTIKQNGQTRSLKFSVMK